VIDRINPTKRGCDLLWRPHWTGFQRLVRVAATGASPVMSCKPRLKEGGVSGGPAVVSTGRREAPGATSELCRSQRCRKLRGGLTRGRYRYIFDPAQNSSVLKSVDFGGDRKRLSISRESAGADPPEEVLHSSRKTTQSRDFAAESIVFLVTGQNENLS
jgi:hypothetical protein